MRKRRWKRRFGKYPTWSISASWSTTTVPTVPSKSRTDLACRPSLMTATTGTAAISRPATAKLAAGAEWSSWSSDYQYTPLLVTAMASMVAYGVYDVVLGSRIIGGTALRGGMPLYKYVANRRLPLLRTCSCASSSRSITPVIALSAATYSLACLCGRTATISYSTTRCSPNASISVFALAKFPAPPSISRKRPPLISAAACNMASEFSQLLCNSRFSAPASSATPSSAKMENPRGRFGPVPRGRIAHHVPTALTTPVKTYIPGFNDFRIRRVAPASCRLSQGASPSAPQLGNGIKCTPRLTI